MKLHRNAKTTPTSRLELVRRTVDAGAPCGRGCGITITTGHTRV